MLLSVLDQSPISEGSTGADALHNTIDLARLTDELGYHRYWVAEHHGGPMLAGGSPEALIGPIASATERIRVGSGGVMLPHYSPYKVAETFTILARAVPGADRPRDRSRIRHRPADDVRAPARPPSGLARRLPAAARRAARGTSRTRCPTTIRSSGSRGTFPGCRSCPRCGCSAPRRRARVWAAQLGLPYAFADFINPGGAEFARVYRERFEAVRALSAPRTAWPRGCCARRPTRRRRSSPRAAG